MGHTLSQRVDFYSKAFPDRPPLNATSTWITGTWCIGACYANPNKLYGAYPHGYLKRVHSMFPDAESILHVFSGGLTADYAREEAGGSPSVRIELADAKGPEEGRHPTWQGDVHHLPQEWTDTFDLVLADPPYSKEESNEQYGIAMPNCSKVIREIRRVAKLGATLVWLDTKWPMHRKDEWKTYGHIGLVRSTNHRMRLVSMFEAV